MRQENEKNAAGFEKMQISAIKYGKFDKTCSMYNMSVQAIGKNKHIIFRHLTTAVVSGKYHQVENDPW